MYIANEKVVVIDLDGCLCNDEHRRHLINGKTKDYDKYNSLCHLDTPANLSVLLPFMEGNYGIFTGRHESERAKTLAWIRSHDLPAPRFLFMRPHQSKMPGHELKLKMMEHLETVNIEVLLFIDDRNHILGHMSAHGYNVMKVALKEANKTSINVLEEAIEIQKDRSQSYGSVHSQIGVIMKGHFPKGLLLETEEDFVRFCNFHLATTKGIRYANNLKEGGHYDSALDAANYFSILASMTEGE